MSNGQGFYMWWVEEKARPPIAEDTHVFQLAHRAWELRREIDALDDPEEIRLIRAAWDDAATHTRTQEDASDDSLRERVWTALVAERPELEHATIDLPERVETMRREIVNHPARAEVLDESPRSGALQFVWWGWGRWKNLGRLGPWPDTPHRPKQHGCIYSWRFNLGFLEIRRWA